MTTVFTSTADYLLEAPKTKQKKTKKPQQQQKKNYCPTSHRSVLSPRHHLFLPLVFDYKESGRGGGGTFLDTLAPR